MTDGRLTDGRLTDGRLTDGRMTTAGSPAVGFRVTPLLVGAVLAMIGLAAALLLGTPWGRQQLALSTTRLPDAYWELYLQDPAKAAQCPSPGSAVRLAVVMRNRGTESIHVSWQALLVRPNVVAAVVASGQPDLAPGRATVVTLSYRAPAGEYTVEVHDEAQTHRLMVNCPRTAPS